MWEVICKISLIFVTGWPIDSVCPSTTSMGNSVSCFTCYPMTRSAPLPDSSPEAWHKVRRMGRIWMLKLWRIWARPPVLRGPDLQKEKMHLTMRCPVRQASSDLVAKFEPFYISFFNLTIFDSNLNCILNCQ
jgi:hypothetical protein